MKKQVSCIKCLSISIILLIVTFAFCCKHDANQVIDKQKTKEKLELKTLIIDGHEVSIFDEMNIGETEKDRVVVVATPSPEESIIDYFPSLKGINSNEWLLLDGDNTLTITIKKADRQKVYTLKIHKSATPSNISNKLRLKKIYIINANTNTRFTDRWASQYEFNNEYYKIKSIIPIKEIIKEATFLLEPEDMDVKAKYFFSDSLINPKTIKTWNYVQKEKFTFVSYGRNIELDCFPIKNKELDYKHIYLYLAFEKDNEKTFFITDMERKKEATDDVSKLSIVKEYRDDEGNSLEEQHPFATKGFIRVMPRNPRAKVELVTPEAKSFIKEGNGYFNITIPLNDDFTKFSYKIISEDGSKEKLYDEETAIFIKQVVVSYVRFTYDKSTPIYDGVFAKNIDGTRYLNFEKKLVKDKKLYLYVNAFKDVKFQHEDFTKLEETSLASFTTTLFEVNIASFIDAAPYNKTFSLISSYKEKYIQALNIVMLPKDDIISQIEVMDFPATRLLDGKYVVAGEMSGITYGNNIIVDLNLLEGEDPSTTRRCIKLFKGTKEITGVVVDTTANGKLRFKLEGFTIGKKETVTITIKYYEDKDTTTTREYILKIIDNV